MMKAKNPMYETISTHLTMNSFMAGSRRRSHVNRPWQCLYFLPEPHGQGSLRPTLPHDFGSLGLRCAERAAEKPPAATPAGASASAISSSPVAGSTLCASIYARLGG